MVNEGPRTTGDVPVGSPGTCLVILRGNSGSGKSTIARAVRDRYGRGCALVEQDYLRRTVLRERDVPGGNAAALIEHVVRFALDVGYHVICEGILHGSRYGPMLTRLAHAHRGATTVFYLDVPFDETLRRHTGRPQAREFTPDDMRGWYVPHDLLGIPGEQVIDGSKSLDDAVGLVAAHLPPIATPLPVANGREEWRPRT
ncbi:kinase [Pseudonocardia xinjiangensis]|uniref:Kinase n=1 Tax=Pseudonocardia xinjiangensis TaxID=75289 RepID=A0ABX1R7C2_9PSEU|nr:kinase [Pseudonocardia xinjiangensis]NMH75554.1 kinase [Pseudonocardia xinjiangensis]